MRKKDKQSPTGRNPSPQTTETTMHEDIRDAIVGMQTKIEQAQKLLEKAYEISEKIDDMMIEIEREEGIES